MKRPRSAYSVHSLCVSGPIHWNDASRSGVRVTENRQDSGVASTVL